MGYGRELFVDYKFYNDLAGHKQNDFVSENYLYIIQGKKDDIVDYMKNQNFFGKYFKNNHEFFYFENADHRFKKEGELKKIVEIARDILI